MYPFIYINTKPKKPKGEWVSYFKVNRRFQHEIHVFLIAEFYYSNN